MQFMEGYTMKEQKGKGGSTLYAINKTAGKAFRKSNEAGEWEAVDPKSITGSAALERAGHEKIGNNWCSIYKAGA
jgi:hypothetical protein